LPLYEYACTKCGRRTEKIQKFSDPPLTTCEICHGRLERLLSAPAIQFKGAGWYVTDYARKSTGPESKPAESFDSAGKSESSAAAGKKDKSGTPSAEPAKAPTKN